MDRLISLNEVLARCGISRSFLYQELSRGRIEAVKIGKRTAFREGEVARYLADLPSARIGRAAKPEPKRDSVTPVVPVRRRKA